MPERRVGCGLVIKIHLAIAPPPRPNPHSPDASCAGLWGTFSFGFWGCVDVSPVTDEMLSRYKQTADPSTPLRSGRDDSFCGWLRTIFRGSAASRRGAGR